jgi:hypothetical protein
MVSEIETLKEQLNYVQLENIRLSNYASHEFQEEGSHPEKRRSFFKKMFH